MIEYFEPCHPERSEGSLAIGPILRTLKGIRTTTTQWRKFPEASDSILRNVGSFAALRMTGRLSC